MAVSPTEKDGLELGNVNGYGTKEDDSDEHTKEQFDNSLEVPSTTVNDNEDSDYLDEEEEKEKFWIKLFPWLLKWSWFRQRCYKKKKDKCKLLLYVVDISLNVCMRASGNYVQCFF